MANPQLQKPQQVSKPSLIIQKFALTLDCGNCGSRHFAIKVLPQNGRGKIVGLQCIKCEKIFRVDSQAWIEGAGVANLNPSKLITGVKPNV